MKFNIYKIYLILSLILGLSIPVSAYEPVFVQGRVWEYYWGIHMIDLCWTRKFMVDGTVERFGKTYSVVRSLDTADTLALVREEDGKAWRLGSSDWLMIDIHRYAAYPANDERLWLADVQPTDSTEYLLYDFSLSKGSSIQQIAPPQKLYVRESGGKKIYGCYNYIINDVDTIQTAKGMMKSMKLNAPYLSYNWDLSVVNWQIAEGIGYIMNGYPHEPYFGVFHNGNLSSEFSIINRVFDPDGSVIYIYLNFGTTLTTGQKWIYWNADSSDTRNGYYETLSIGEEVEIEGRTYYILRSDKNDKVAYLREKQNKVYKLLENGSEILLYDFNMTIGNRFEYNGEDGDNYIIEVANTYLDNGPERYLLAVAEWIVTSPDSEIKKEVQARVIAGIIKGGTFADFDFNNSSRDITLLRVEDSEGKLLYENKDSGVETIAGERVDDGRMYDLSGREIREPQRGTVYIQGGRKMVKR